MPFLTYENDQIFYSLKKKEACETIVMVHSNVSDHTLFDTFVPSIEKNYSILRYDLRGYGRSSLGKKAPSIEQFVEDLLYLVQTLKIKKFHLVGLGTGALIAVRFTRLYEELVQRLVLLSMPCNPPNTIKDIRAHRAELSQNGKLIPIDYILSVATALPMDREEVKKVRQVIRYLNPEVYAEVMDLTVSAQPIDDLQAIEVPTFILSGENDVVFPPYYLEMHAISLPHCRFMMIPNCSNFIVVDKPAFSAELIIDFIESNIEQKTVDDPFLNVIYEETRSQFTNVTKRAIMNYANTNKIEVYILTAYHVYINDVEVVKGWNQRFAKQILIYLLFHKSATREQLCEALWPEVLLTQSKKNLTVYLSYLKKLISTDDTREPFLITDREFIHLTGDVRSDALSFIQVLQQCLTERNAVEKFKLGQRILLKLDPHYLTTTYENWFMELRDRVEDMIVDIVLWMGDHLVSNEGTKRAIEHLINCLPLLDDNELIYDKIILLYGEYNDDVKVETWIKKKEVVWGSMMLE